MLNYKMIRILILISIILEISACNLTNQSGPPKNLHNHINKVYDLTFQKIPRETSDLKLNKNAENEIKQCVYKSTHSWIVNKPHYEGYVLIKEEFFDNDAILTYQSLNKYKKADDLDRGAILAWTNLEATVRENMKDCFYSLYKLNVQTVEVMIYEWDSTIKWAS